MHKILVLLVLAALMLAMPLAVGAAGDAAMQRGENHPVWVWAYKSGCDAAGYGAVASGFNTWATSGNAWYLFWAYTGNGGRDWAGFYGYCQYYWSQPTARLMSAASGRGVGMGND